MDRIKRCLNEGKSSELSAIQILSKYFGKKYKVESSDSNDDINNHIDIFLINKTNKIGFDVKDKPEGMDEYQYIEYSNVNGKPGWIFGKAKYIMFRTSSFWLVLDRERLLFECNKKWVEYKSPVNYSKKDVQNYGFIQGLIIIVMI